jgi:hypothetical protein
VALSCQWRAPVRAPPVQRTVRDEFEAAARIDRLQWILAITGFQPPDGFSYTAHSVRWQLSRARQLLMLLCQKFGTREAEVEILMLCKFQECQE